jgi:hypothetical protein
MAWAGLGLAGCETGGSFGSFFGSSNSTQIAEPVASAKPAETQPPLARVSVAPIIGAPDGVAKQIQDEFSGAIERQRVSVSTGKDDRVDYTLRGYIVAAKDKSGTKVSYIWDVTDQTGKRVNRITGEEVVSGHASKDPWAAITPTVAQSVSGKAANSLVAWLQTQGSQGAVASSSSTGQRLASVQQPSRSPARRVRLPSQPLVRHRCRARRRLAASAGTSRWGGLGAGRDGCAGDGSRSLAAAIQRELSGKGVAVSERATPGAYRVEGTVVMGQAEGGKQSIQIEWMVRDPQGKKLGTVSQKNEIAEGSLDGPWGKVADQAAGAARAGHRQAAAAEQQSYQLKS